MRMIDSESKNLNVALGRGLRTFKPWNWVWIWVAVPLLLTALLWVTAPQLGQAQGAPPAKPTGLAAVSGDTQATLSWDDPFDGSLTGHEYLQVRRDKLTASDGAAGDEFGFAVAVDGDTAVVGAYGDDGYQGAAYVFTRQSGAWSQVAKLTASDGAGSAHFGASIAVDGDTIVAGADEDDSGKGSAYVFTKPNGAWVDATETAKLTSSIRDNGDFFGVSVAVDGDTVVAGADEDDNGEGSAYVFTKPGGGWATATETAKLTASDRAADDRFGESVAVEGDTVVVGANGDDSSKGSAYVFKEPSGGWTDVTETAKLTASDRDPNDNFGWSVALEGDTVVVGVYEDDGGRGSAYVFTQPNGGWATDTQTAKLTASDRAAADWFGESVAVDGDTVVVGANGDDDNGLNSGSAYVFKKPNSGWSDATQTAKLTASDGARGDDFGFSVALDGDTVVVGADGDDGYQGSAYAYTASGWTAIPDSAAGGTNVTSHTVTSLTNGAEHSVWVRATNNVGAGPASDAVSVIVGLPAKPTGLAATAGDTQATLNWDDPSDISITWYEYFLHRQVAKLTASNREAGDQFGNSVSVDGDTAVVGAWGDDDYKGAAYVFTRQSGAWSQVAKLTATDGAINDNLGRSVAVDGNTVVVGAFGDNGGQGSAYVFSKPGGGWATATETARLTASDGAANDYFGKSVAVDGNTVVVGAWQDDNSRGSAYVFTEPGGGWADATQTARLTAYDRDVGDYFGTSVAVNGNTVVVGADHDDNTKGSAYVFSKPGGGWVDATQTARLTAYDRDAGDLLGRSVAVDGNTVVVGAWGNDNTKGSAYVFTEPGGGWSDATETARLTAHDRDAGDAFGWSVAADGNMVVAGAWGDDDSRGSAYVFTKPSGGWADATETARLTANDRGAGDEFGHSVAVDGDTVVVGAWKGDGGEGSAYVYEVSDWTSIPDSRTGETNAISHTVTGLTNGAEHSFRIRATNNVGVGPASDAVTMTPAS